jgi:CheY-like chemotaxis protein
MKSFEPAAVLLDIGLPQIDGYEVARRLRADHTLQDVYIIASTGYGKDSDIAQARDAGFDAHLLKPAKMDDALELISNLPKNRFH